MSASSTSFEFESICNDLESLSKDFSDAHFSSSKLHLKCEKFIHVLRKYVKDLTYHFLPEKMTIFYAEFGKVLKILDPSWLNELKKIKFDLKTNSDFHQRKMSEFQSAYNVFCFLMRELNLIVSLNESSTKAIMEEISHYEKLDGNNRPSWKIIKVILNRLITIGKALNEEWIKLTGEFKRLNGILNKISGFNFSTKQTPSDAAGDSKEPVYPDNYLVKNLTFFEENNFKDCEKDQSDQDVLNRIAKFQGTQIFKTWDQMRLKAKRISDFLNALENFVPDSKNIKKEWNEMCDSYKQFDETFSKIYSIKDRMNRCGPEEKKEIIQEWHSIIKMWPAIIAHCRKYNSLFGQISHMTPLGEFVRQLFDVEVAEDNIYAISYKEYLEASDAKSTPVKTRGSNDNSQLIAIQKLLMRQQDEIKKVESERQTGRLELFTQRNLEWDTTWNESIKAFRVAELKGGPPRPRFVKSWFELHPLYKDLFYNSASVSSSLYNSASTPDSATSSSFQKRFCFSN